MSEKTHIKQSTFILSKAYSTTFMSEKSFIRQKKSTFIFSKAYSTTFMSEKSFIRQKQSTFIFENLEKFRNWNIL